MSQKITPRDKNAQIFALTDKEGVTITPDELGLKIEIDDLVFGKQEIAINWDLAEALAALLNIMLRRREEHD